MSSEVLTAPVACPPDWPIVRLRQIARKIGSGATPTGGQAAYQQTRSQFALIRSQNVFDRAFSDAGLAFISDAQADGLRSAHLEPGDLLLNITGDGVTFGRACMVPQAVLPACVNQHVSIIRLESSRADPGYLLSYLTHPGVKEYIEAFNAGGSRRAITKAHIESFVVPLPPLVVQQSIAHVLSALDDRITLLRETNATLEAIAQALFKSWFVDFDPVRAKQQGLAPGGMDEATAAMFPDGFEETDRRSAPRGWREASIYEVAQVVYGAPFASSRFNTDGLGRPLVRIRDLRDEAPGVHTQEVHPKGYLLSPGDIVVGMDGEFRAYLWGGEQAWLNQRVCVFQPKAGVPAAFVRATIEPQLAHIEATETATTVIHLGKGDIDRFVALVPRDDVLAAFGAIADPLYARIVANKQTCRSLAAIRDTLLPRLISGQLRLPEAEAIAD